MQQPYDDGTSKPLVAGAYPAPYPAASPVYGAYPPPASATGPTHMSGMGCTLHREDLDQYLSISSYGSNVAMFNCYFVRDGPTTPPLCIACRRTIGDHSSRNPGPMPQLAVPVPATGHYAGAPPMMVPVGPCPPPAHMTIGDTCDVARVPFAQGTFIGLGIISVILAVQIIAFSATGMFSRSPIVLIGPGILGFMLVLLIFFSKAYVLTFQKGLGMGPHSRVDVVERRILGCSTTRNTTVGELGQVVCRPTNTRVNRQVIFEVVALAPTGQATPLFRGYHYECAPHFTSWQHYLTQYGIAPQSVGMPAAFMF